MAQEEDVLVEENVTPFYMNSGRLRIRVAEKIHLFVFLGENLEETLHRLGIDLPKNTPNEHNY